MSEQRVCRCYQGCIKYGLNSPLGPRELNDNVFCFNDLSEKNRNYIISLGLNKDKMPVPDTDENENVMEKNSGSDSVAISELTSTPMVTENQQRNESDSNIKQPKTTNTHGSSTKQQTRKSGTKSSVK